ncbi:ABC multidrug transporter lscH [Dirofilaria immitis]
MLHFLSKYIGRSALKTYIYSVRHSIYGFFLRILKQMHLWFMNTTSPTTTTFITSITGSIIIAIVLLSCALKKPKRPYKPGHLPQFLDPNAREADTYYGMRSTIAFPVKGIEIKRKYNVKARQAKSHIESNLKKEKRDVQGGRIQSEKISIGGSSKPVGLFM